MNVRSMCLVGRRSAMIWSIVVFSIGAALTGMAEGYWSLFFARAITGLGVGGELLEGRYFAVGSITLDDVDPPTVLASTSE